MNDTSDTYELTTFEANFCKAAQDGAIEALLGTASCQGQLNHPGCLGEDCDTSMRDNPGAVFAASAEQQIRDEVTDFCRLVFGPDGYGNREHIFLYWGDGERFGHDFTLTRNRHGAGYWDRGAGELGTWLTDHAHPYGEQSVYVGKFGLLYVQ